MRATLAALVLVAVVTAHPHPPQVPLTPRSVETDGQDEMMQKRMLRPIGPPTPPSNMPGSNTMPSWLSDQSRALLHTLPQEPHARYQTYKPGTPFFYKDYNFYEGLPPPNSRTFGRHDAPAWHGAEAASVKDDQETKGAVQEPFPAGHQVYKPGTPFFHKDENFYLRTPPPDSHAIDRKEAPSQGPVYAPEPAGGKLNEKANNFAQEPFPAGHQVYKPGTPFFHKDENFYTRTPPPDSRTTDPTDALAHGIKQAPGSADGKFEEETKGPQAPDVSMKGTTNGGKSSKSPGKSSKSKPSPPYSAGSRARGDVDDSVIGNYILKPIRAVTDRVSSLSRNKPQREIGVAVRGDADKSYAVDDGKVQLQQEPETSASPFKTHTGHDL